MKKILFGLADTKKFAEEFSKKLKPKKSGATVIGLIGELGAGKTTFVKSLIKSFSVKEKVVSPTFIIIKRFPVDKEKLGFKNIYHLDCYRISSKELVKLGFKEALKEKENLIIIEWADIIKDILPPNSIWIKMSHSKNSSGRIIEIK